MVQSLSSIVSGGSGIETDPEGVFGIPSRNASFSGERRIVGIAAEVFRSRNASKNIRKRREQLESQVVDKQPSAYTSELKYPARRSLFR